MLAHITTNIANGGVRHDTLHGRDYLVAPVAMITAGVHNGSNGPLLYEEADIAKAVPAWNMKPIVVYHPMINDVGVSAADKDILESSQVGHVMNCSFTDGKLRAEAWIDKELAQNVDVRVLDALESNRVMEVSTGLFTDNEAVEGREYTAVTRNHQPDHLALLPDQVGACSVADGAGLLVANKGGMSHGKISMQLHKLIRERVPYTKKADGEVVGPWIADVYDKYFIYEMDDKYYQLSYTSGKAGVELGDTPQEVVRVTEYRNADNGKLVGNAYAPNKTKNTTMKKDEIVDGLIANTGNQWGEDDRQTLMDTPDAVLNAMAKDMDDEDEDKMKAKKGKKPTANADADGDKTPVQAAAEQGAEGIAPAPQPAAQPVANTTEAYIAQAPAEVQSLLRNGLAAHNAEQERLIGVITSNANNRFTKEFLATKDLQELQGLAAIAQPVANAADTEPEPGKVAMFHGAATPAGVVQNAGAATEEEALEAPTLNWEESNG